MTRIILASGSKIRATILAGAGVSFSVIPSDVDESHIKAECRELGHDIRDIAMRLAVAKATEVSRQNADALVIGADQILGLGEQMFDKPVSMEEAASRLALLSGKRHVLYNAACVVLNGEVVWQVITYPTMTMRALTDDDIATYLGEAGESVLSSVGAYQLEALGARLFRQVEGDYFSVLGLPLLPLLAFLREQKVLAY